MSPGAREKATVDVIRVLRQNEMLPEEETVVALENSELFTERFLDKLDSMAYQFQIIQALTWFGGFSTGIMADTLPIGEGWEWNQEFFDLVEKGIPHEEAYALWTARIEKEEGEFDPMKHSPFRASQNSKKTFAVVEATQDANEWLVENQEFVETFGLSS